MLLEPEQVHFGQKLLPRDPVDNPHVRIMHPQLFLWGGDADNIIGPRRQLLPHRLTRTPKEYRLEVLTQLSQVLVAKPLALFVHDPAAVVDAKTRPTPAIVDELRKRT